MSIFDIPNHNISNFDFSYSDSYLFTIFFLVCCCFFIIILIMLFRIDYHKNISDKYKKQLDSLMYEIQNNIYHKNHPDPKLSSLRISWNKELALKNAQISQLQQLLDTSERELASIAEAKQNKADEWNAAKEELYNNLSQFYTKKESCMNINESRMFYYINSALDALIPDPEERKTFWVFPQVSLYSFVKLLNGTPSASYNIARSSYIAKSIDFVICHCNKKFYAPFHSDKKAYYYYAYNPILLIELDGTSHSSSTPYGEKAFQRQQENDQFKDMLTDSLHLNLIRYTLSSGQIRAEDAFKIRQEISNHIKPFLSST